MKRITLAFIAATIFLFSCTKEKSVENGGIVPGSTGAKDSLLVKTVIAAGDSTVNLYGYDAARRLISINSTSTSQGSVYNDQTTLRRNSNGIVVQTIQKSDSLRAQGFDSLVYNVIYNASKSRYVGKVATFTISGFTVKDSIGYSYDASGKLVGTQEFVTNGLVPYVNVGKEDISYDASGNIADVKNYAIDPNSGTSTVASDETFQYDTRVNPLMLGNEAFLVDIPELLSPFNVLSDNFTVYTTPLYNEVTSFAYVYNSVDKPNAALVSFSSGGAAPMRYYYQP